MEEFSQRMTRSDVSLLKKKTKKFFRIYKISSTNNMVDLVDKVGADIVVEVVQIVGEVEVHNHQMGEMACRRVVVVVPYLGH